MGQRRAKFGDMVGEVLTHIDIDPENDVVLLTTASGRQFRIYHEQDCCESVVIAGVDGEWNQLLGKRIEEANASDVTPETYPEESRTDTDVVFRVTDATVIVKWVGTSNGYYSEEVDFCELM